jgi:peptidoglycan/LPS O-acetylase OafA/YrhL
VQNSARSRTIDAVTQDIRKYRFIDALRGYSILAVIFVHSSQSVRPASLALQTLMSHGARGVQLFFIASALTLSLSWDFRRTQEKSPTRNFYMRRFFRIAPMFYTAILFYVVLYGFSSRYWAPNGIQWWFVPLTALFLNGYLPETITSVVPGGWSIAVEMNFYLVLPFILRYLTTRRSLVVFLIATLALSAATRLMFGYIFAPHFPPDQEYLVSNFAALNFFGQLPIFAAGLLVASLFRTPALLKRVVVYGGLILIAIVIASLTLRLLPNIVDHYIFIGFGLALFAGFLACYQSKILVNWAVVHIGTISFSMYLTHFAVIEAFSKFGFTTIFHPGNLSSILYYLCAIAVTAPVSYFFYNVIEKPGIQLGKRLIGYLESRDSAVMQQHEAHDAPRMLPELQDRSTLL